MYNDIYKADVAPVGVFPKVVESLLQAISAAEDEKAFWLYVNNEPFAAEREQLIAFCEDKYNHYIATGELLTRNG